MDADIEELVLSGKLFGGGERSNSPARSPSPDSGWHDDEQSGNDSDTDRNAQIEKSLGSAQQGSSIGMGPGRTGVKGVIRDRNEASAISRSQRAKELEEMNRQMEKASLGGKTFLEEEREKNIEKALREGGAPRIREDVFGHKMRGKFGHLREVGVKGFVSAVEEEERGVWVVVHLYDPSLERCYFLDEKLARLARTYPNTKFLRARAVALGFASKASSSSRAPKSSSRLSSIPDDEEDPYGDGDAHDDTAGSQQGDVDTDMLPTMLVYRDGDLVQNWVRVDWEAEKAGIEELLVSHHILPRGFSASAAGFASDEEDLVWSDEDETFGL
ncbi:hypothetical protein PLICRDRAFT_55935 [Plicaturopsis crispa FD-325 SS-3]|nr:hypothetical protein PLICRDRAFT_55935 [Plicaturopsis crispa FD-325 SS-3]